MIEEKFKTNKGGRNFKFGQKSGGCILYSIPKDYSFRHTQKLLSVSFDTFSLSQRRYRHNISWKYCFIHYNISPLTLNVCAGTTGNIKDIFSEMFDLIMSIIDKLVTNFTSYTKTSKTFCIKKAPYVQELTSKYAEITWDKTVIRRHYRR